MSHKVGNLRLSILKAIAEHDVGTLIRLLLAAMLALALVGLVVYAGLRSGGKTAETIEAPVLPTTGPQLSEAPSVVSSDAFIAANPELTVLLRYAARVASATEAEVLATNPEVRIFLQHAARFAEQTDDDFMARNPELRILLRHSNERVGQ